VSITKDFENNFIYSAFDEGRSVAIHRVPLAALLARTRALEASFLEEHQAFVAEHESWEDHISGNSAWFSGPCGVCKLLGVVK
jgi:hypothetical protein